MSDVNHRAEHEHHLANGKTFRHGCHVCVPDGASPEDLIQDVIDAANDVVRDVHAANHPDTEDTL